MSFIDLNEIKRRAQEKSEQVKNLFSDRLQEKGEELRLTTPTVDPFGVKEVGGLMGECMEWVIRNARSPLPEFAAFSAIALFSVLFGRRAVGPTGLGLNVYLVMVAPTGSGKDWPLKAVRVFLQSLGPVGKALVGPTNVTGDSAIERALQKHPCLYMAIDEFGLLLQAATNPRAAAWTQTISRAFLELYSRSGAHDSWKAKSTAVKRKGVKDTPIEQPTVTIVGATTPPEFYAGLTTGSTSNGFLNRLVVLMIKDRPELQDVDAIPLVPDDLKEKLLAAVSGFPGNTDTAKSDSPAEMFVVPFADEVAKGRFSLIQSDQRKMLDSDGDLSGLAERVGENALKLATLRAISRESNAPSITVGDLEWSWAIICRSIDCVSEGVARYMSGSQAEALRKLILQHIVDAGPTGLPKSWLMKKRGVGKAAPYELTQSLDWLEKSGEIAQIGKSDAKGGRGRSGEKFVATEHYKVA